MTWFLSCNQVCRLEPRINHFCNRTHLDRGTGLAISTFRSSFLFFFNGCFNCFVSRSLKEVTSPLHQNRRRLRHQKFVTMVNLQKNPNRMRASQRKEHKQLITNKMSLATPRRLYHNRELTKILPLSKNPAVLLKDCQLQVFLQRKASTQQYCLPLIVLVYCTRNGGMCYHPFHPKDTRIPGDNKELDMFLFLLPSSMRCPLAKVNIVKTMFQVNHPVFHVFTYKVGPHHVEQ